MLELLTHPHYHAIFSRQAGTGTSLPYPHIDLRPRVEQVVELVTWERVLWGSEFPIICQRSELPDAVRDWLLNLGVDISHEDAHRFFAGYAQRLFFSQPAPSAEKISVPGWVQEQTNPTQSVYFFPANQVYLKMHDHGTLLSHYMHLSANEPDLDYSTYIARLLYSQAEHIRELESRL